MLSNCFRRRTQSNMSVKSKDDAIWAQQPTTLMYAIALCTVLTESNVNELRTPTTCENVARAVSGFKIGGGGVKKIFCLN